MAAAGFFAKIRAKMDQWKKEHLGNYSDYVNQDIAYRRSKSSGMSAIDPDDYPTVGRVAQALEPSLVIAPLPTTNHFVFDISEADRQNFEQAQIEKYQMAQMDAIARISKPLEKLIAKLDSYAGAKSGERFHESLITNVLNGSIEAENLTIDASDEYKEQLATIAQKVNGIVVDGIRENDLYRQSTKEELDALNRKLSIFAPVI
jgi:hypothetical protein